MLLKITNPLLYRRLMDTLRWMRMIGDTIFAIGVLALAWFVFWLKGGWSVLRQTADPVLESKRIATQHVDHHKPGEKDEDPFKETSALYAKAHFTQIDVNKDGKLMGNEIADFGNKFLPVGPPVGAPPKQ